MKRLRLSTRFLITLGLVSMLLSACLLAMFLDLIPDSVTLKRQGRTALAEAVAANGSAFMTLGDLLRLETTLSLVVTRNPGLLSAGVRAADGSLVVQVGEHAAHWTPSAGGLSTDSQVIVPILAGDKPWGSVELRFSPLAEPGWRGWLGDSRLRLIGFLCLVTIPLFYFYMGRTLKQLDPSQAVPTRVRTALDTLLEGLLVLDLEGRIVLANQAFAGFVRETPEALVGRAVGSFAWASFDGQPLAPSAYPWALALSRGELVRNAAACLRDERRDEHRFFIVNCSPIIVGEGRHGGLLISLEDITQLQHKEGELRLARDQAQSANQAKSDFLANISHEIRTPMNAILGFTEMLRRGYQRNPEDTSKYLHTIHNSARHLLELINGILDLSKIEAGRLEIEQVRFPAHRVIQEVLQVLSARAAEQGLALGFKVEGPIPETILSDPARLRQIITNLVGNALKFTARGGVDLRLRLDAGPRLIVEVADTGIGIPAERLESIFEPFVQAEASTTRRFGGTGLGLTISRRFARLLGGDITVSSSPGAGSVFTLSLDPGPLEGVPLLLPEQLAQPAEEAPSEAPVRWHFRSQQVLVVDDGAENRELVRLVLEAEGLRVEEAGNGQIALDRVAGGHFDLVLMDMQMPVMDGFSATRRLREEGRTLPIVALTANAMKGFEQELLAAGCTAYLTKPVDIDRLLDTVAGILGAKPTSLTPVELSPAAPSSVSLPEDQTATPAPVISRLAEHPRLRGVVRKFGLQLGERLAVIEEAQACLDYEQLAQLGHWLKGAAGTVGFDDLTEPARALEQAAKNCDPTQVAAAVSAVRDLAQRLVIPDDAAAAPLQQ